MTIRQALTAFDGSKFNTVSQTQKIKWLSRLDGLICRELHPGSLESFAGYDENTDLDTALLVPFPYDEIYGYYLESRMHYLNEEFDRFNNANAMYENVRQRYYDNCLRSHTPQSAGQFH